MKRYFNQTWDNNNHSNSQFDNGNSLEKKKNEDPSTTVSSSSWFSTIEKNKPPIHQTFSSTHASSNNLETKMKTIHVDQDHFQNSEKVITREPCSSLEEKEKEKEEHTKKTKEMLNLEWTIHSNLISSPFQTSFFQNKNTSKSKTKFTQLQHPPSLSSSSYTLSKTTTTTTMTSTVTTSAELSSSQKLLPFTLDQEPILKKAKTVHSNSNTFSEYSSSSSSSSLPPVTFSEFYSFLSFRFLHLNEAQENIDVRGRQAINYEELPNFIIQHEFLYRIYLILVRYLPNPLPFILTLSNYSDTSHVPLLLENFDPLTKLTRKHPHFDIHVCARQFESIASEITSQECHEKFTVYVYVTKDHVHLKQWQKLHPHVFLRTVGRLPQRHRTFMEHATHLDFWEKQLMVDRQVLYHESNEDEDFMQRPIVQTSKLKVELIDYVVAWNIFRGENKSNAIVILLNDTKGIQNLISFLRRKNIWVIHSRSADEFRLIKSWIVSCCF